MKAKIEFIRPQSLNIGDFYLFRERNPNGERLSTSAIRFVNYTPCPAIVIIKYFDGSKQRCLRADLFKLGVGNHQVSRVELASLFQQYTTNINNLIKRLVLSIKFSLLKPSP